MSNYWHIHCNLICHISGGVYLPVILVCRLSGKLEGSKVEKVTNKTEILCNNQNIYIFSFCSSYSIRILGQSIYISGETALPHLQKMAEDCEGNVPTR